jgi:hypothetical protein
MFSDVKWCGKEKKDYFALVEGSRCSNHRIHKESCELKLVCN